MGVDPEGTFAAAAEQLLILLAIGAAMVVGAYELWHNNFPHSIPLTPPFLPSNSIPTPKATVDSSKYPESARHIKDCQSSSHPDRVTIDRKGAKQNRRNSPKDKKTKKEGEKGASVRNINPSDNWGAGASLGRKLQKYPDGTQVRVK